MTIDPATPASSTTGRINPARVDATTEDEIAAQAAADEAEAMQDAAKSLLKVLDRAPEAALAALN